MHPHDKSWIDDQLAMIAGPLATIASGQYARIYQDNLAKDDAHGENKARNAANTWLRLHIERLNQPIRPRSPVSIGHFGGVGGQNATIDAIAKQD